MIKKYDPIIQAIFASLFTWGMFIIHYHLFTHYIYGVDSVYAISESFSSEIYYLALTYVGTFRSFVMF